MNKRILVVEGDPVTCEVLQVVLEDFGFEIMIVHDAEQCLQVGRDAPPQLVLLDFSLPNALELCCKLKAQTATRNSAVILMTHNLSEQELAGVVSSEADGQVSKPFSPLGLLAIVHECLQRRVVAAT